MFVLFKECLSWTFVAFKSGCSVNGALGLDPCGVCSVSGVYEALGLDVCGVLRHL